MALISREKRLCSGERYADASARYAFSANGQGSGQFGHVQPWFNFYKDSTPRHPPPGGPRPGRRRPGVPAPGAPAPVPRGGGPNPNPGGSGHQPPPLVWGGGPLPGAGPGPITPSQPRGPGLPPRHIPRRRHGAIWRVPSGALRGSFGTNPRRIWPEGGSLRRQYDIPARRKLGLGYRVNHQPHPWTMSDGDQTFPGPDGYRKGAGGSLVDNSSGALGGLFGAVRRLFGQLLGHASVGRSFLMSDATGVAGTMAGGAGVPTEGIG